ncbi:hypothetical protein BABINDRAFT_77386 [Babjeviella inositovora NRRL Y-12698]|uniref:Uncharacterized protein n=1 Tax=Babjeviella inositovora NRRL Y-12698 TaxID=984486 RepID=A0A1E3QYX8_9ASCO|nr:uncharacterized protein BABINDRAFT_77386 [Babjeviella inositovora NRRL Y-12698]ODQ82831.1 hypothetical protein BABINDRAFT_77386 [Babjeviella inositovora NRRL Y-12698]
MQLHGKRGSNSLLVSVCTAKENGHCFELGQKEINHASCHNTSPSLAVRGQDLHGWHALFRIDVVGKPPPSSVDQGKYSFGLYQSRIASTPCSDTANPTRLTEKSACCPE